MNLLQHLYERVIHDHERAKVDRRSSIADQRSPFGEALPSDTVMNLDDKNSGLMN